MKCCLEWEMQLVCAKSTDFNDNAAKSRGGGVVAGAEGRRGGERGGGAASGCQVSFRFSGR